ncbi:MAG: phage major capsid protein [Candidatus Caldarchaeum sp.]
MNLAFEKSKAYDAFLEFGKALLSTDTNFPEIPVEVRRILLDIFIAEQTAAKVFPSITMGSDTVRVYAVGGTVTIYAPGEGTAPTESKLTFNPAIDLVAKELVGRSSVSYTAEEEAIVDLVAKTVEHLGKKMAETVDANILSGKADNSSAAHLFRGIQFADGLTGSTTTVGDLAKAAITVDDVNKAITELEERGYKRLVMFIHPKAAYHLRKALSDKGLHATGFDILKDRNIQGLLGLEGIYETRLLEKRNYNGTTDTTQVTDVIVCDVEETGIIGYRRNLTVEKDRDIEQRLTKVVASTRFAWQIVRNGDAVYKIKNALAQ